MNILDEYQMAAPSKQNALSLFAGEWSSAVPGGYQSGTAALFDDHRVHAIARNIGGLAGKSVLELGPLEGGHSIMMAEQGASSILSIEANSRAFMKCLIVNSIFKKDNIDFVLGNFDLFLEENTRFDFILASGVIYHCENPVKTIVNMCRSSDCIGIWSHYYSESVVRALYADKFEYDGQWLEYDGFKANCFTHNYIEGLEIEGFCGGGNAYTRWMDRDSWFGLFDALGFDFEVLEESADHPNGPQFTAVAKKRIAAP